MGICIVKYFANTGPTLYYSIGNGIYFRFVFALKSVYFSDLLGFKYINLCL